VSLWPRVIFCAACLGHAQARELIGTVLPFHDITFRSGATLRSSRAGLDVLDNCAHRLLYELKMEGLATGLDVHVEVSASPVSSPDVKKPPCEDRLWMWGHRPFLGDPRSRTLTSIPAKMHISRGASLFRDCPVN
jgi:hypothetical protein